MSGISRTKTGYSALGAAAFAIAVSMLILNFAVPRLGAAIVALPGDAIANRVWKRQPVTLRQLDTLVRSRKASLERAPNPDITRDLSRAYHEIWLVLPRERHRPVIEELARVTRLDVTYRPLNAYSWWRYGVAMHALARQPSPDAARAHHMSRIVQWNAGTLTAARVRESIRNWPAFTPDELALLKRELMTLWRRAPGSVMDVARNPVYRGYIRLMLAAEPGAVPDFDRRVRNLR